MDLKPPNISLAMGQHIRVFLKAIDDQSAPRKDLEHLTWCTVENKEGKQMFLGLNPAFTQHLESNDEIWVWNFEVMGHQSMTAVIADVNKGAKIIIRPKASSPPTFVELYAGIGGWTFGADLVSPQHGRMYFVEQDRKVAQACAATHDLDTVEVQEAFKKFLESGQIPKPCVFIEDDRLWMLLALCHVRYGFSSPPCQPWSAVGKKGGLSVKDGRSWAIMFRQSFDTGIVAILCESVPGFSKHVHSKDLVAFAKSCEYQLAVCGVVSLDHALPIQRNRWLAVFLCKSLDKKVDSANRMCAQNLTLPFFKDMGGMEGRHAILPFIDPEDESLLAPCAEALAAMKDPRFVPGWWKESFHATTTEKIMECRTLKRKGFFQAVMASYGRQHTLDPDLLEKNGLYTVVFQHDNASGVRYYHPFEAAAALGWPKQVALPASMLDAWKATGNALSSAHALLAIYQMHRLLGSESPYSDVLPFQNLVERMISQVIDLHTHAPKVIGEFMVVRPRAPPRNPDIESPPVTQVGNAGIFGHEHPLRQEGNNDTKRRKISSDGMISPTIPYTVEQQHNDVVEHLVVANKANHELGPLGVPGENQLMMWLCETVIRKHFDDVSHTAIPMIISSARHRWVQIAWVHQDQDLGQCLKQVLPHVDETHFAWVKIDGTYVRMNQKMQGLTRVCVIFMPNLFQIRLQIGTGIEFDHVVDTTTTMNDITAKFASTMGVSIVDLVCVQNCKIVGPQTFAMSLAQKCISIIWRPRVHRCLNTIIEDSIMQDESRNVWEGIRDHGASLVRFTAKHPIWNNVRTTTKHRHALVKEVVFDLFPDPTPTKALLAKCGGVVLNGEASFEQIPMSFPISLDLQTIRPLPVIQMFMHDPEHEAVVHSVDQATHIKRWIRSPFRVRPEEISIPSDMPIAICAGSFFGTSSRTFTVQCVCQGKLVDPELPFRTTDPLTTLDFRVCPLPGGAPKNEEIKKQLAELLNSKGVPKEDSTARAISVLAKADAEQIRAAINSEDPWLKLKEVANKAKVRLVTHIELKAHQKSGRAEAAAKKQTVAAFQKLEKQKTKEDDLANCIDLSEINIDMTYFECAGNQVKKIMQSDFGTDQAGLCIMSKNQAQKYVGHSSMGCEGLAILAIGFPALTGHTLISIPAIKHNGTPVVVPGCLINCGDQTINFVPKMKNLKLNEVKAAVIEFTVERQGTKDWPSTQNVMQYLGSMLPELRDAKVLSSWAIKTFDANRKATIHPKASYVHGYLRIVEDVLDAVLCRSGKNGIFLVVKAEDHKLDQRFAAVVLTPGPLEDACVKASQFRHSLGVIRLKQGFAIRCRREHLVEARQTLAPDALFIPSGHTAADAKLWVLSRMFLSTSHQELTQGLRDLGWNATAVRQIGPQTWLIAAPDSPPSQHLSVNNQVVLIAPRNAKQSEAQADVQVLPDDSVSVNSEATTSTGTSIPQVSRLDTLKTELQDQIAAAIAEKMKDTDRKFDQIDMKFSKTDASIEKLRGDTQSEMMEIKNEQKVMANTLQSTSSQIISQMTAMFQSMQAETEKGMQALHSHFDTVTNREANEGENKRQRAA